MPSIKKGNLQLMKEINTATILNLLHRGDKLSRAEISSITRLSATTVSALVEELITANMVEEVGERPMVGAGRRAIALQIKAHGGYVVGIFLSNSALICAVFNLHGDKTAEFKTKIAIGNDAMMEQIETALTSCLEDPKVKDCGSMKGIGIAAPGIIDERGETIIYSSYLKLSHLALKERLSSLYPNIPLQIINDSNAAAFAEQYNGIGEDKSHLLYFTINEGIGSGLILNKEIFSGYLGASGEIGHIPVDPEGLICSCGRRGCIETVITIPYILKRCQSLAEVNGKRSPESFEELLQRYNVHEEWLEPVFDKVLYVTTIMVASAVNFISPETIVFEGWMKDSSKFMNKLIDELVKFPFPVPFSPDRICSSSYPDDGALYGAATLMLQKIFKAASIA
jgi:N-acetylglucosamine repressor